ncbi:hypothetical protein MFLAVUS_001284 [Mucor flavus]|uniref:Uncharacterized protein n=1 Tax=Mucor flavus TaxID=439312 RepID=A0ABP9YM36_9FUNG
MARDLVNINLFLQDWHVRVAWIGFATLWVFWGFAWFIRNAFGGDQSQQVVQTNTQVAHDTEGGTHTVNKNQFMSAAPAWSVNVFNRLNRAHDMLRDLVIMLLSVLTINTFARGSTRGVMIVSWLFVAFAVVYFIVEASYEHRYLRLLYSLTFYTLGLAIVGLAFYDGFYDYEDSTVQNNI